MSLRIARRPAVQHLQLAKATPSYSRTFSASTSRGEEEDGRSNERPGVDRDSRRKYVVRMLENSHSDNTEHSPAPWASNQKAGFGARRPNPRRPVYHKDLSTGLLNPTFGHFSPSADRSNTSSDRARSDRVQGNRFQGNRFQGNRSPNHVSAKVLQFKQKLQQGNRGDRRPSRFSGPGGQDFRGKDQRKKRPQRRRMGNTAVEEDEEIEESLQTYIREQQEQQKQVVTRYSPAPYTAAELKGTWPALPISGNTAPVLSTMNWMSANYTGSFHPVDELAKRVCDGERVSFANEAEKEEVLKMARDLAAKRAEKDAKDGATAEPEPVDFEPISGNDKKRMIDTLLRGGYETGAGAGQTGASPILANVARNLSNNSTYTSTDTARLLAKLSKGLPAAKPAAKAKPAAQ